MVVSTSEDRPVPRVRKIDSISSKKITAGAERSVNDRGHFFALAARVMRQVICDYARERMAQKRGAGERGIPLEEIEVAEVKQAMQLIELRSGREGHPSYRAVAHAMWDEIDKVHPAVARIASATAEAPVTVTRANSPTVRSSRPTTSRISGSST